MVFPDSLSKALRGTGLDRRFGLCIYVAVIYAAACLCLLDMDAYRDTPIYTDFLILSGKVCPGPVHTPNPHDSAGAFCVFWPSNRIWQGRIRAEKVVFGWYLLHNKSILAGRNRQCGGRRRCLDMVGKILNNMNRIIVGKENISKLILTAMLAGGHVLIEDVPGVGKTTFANVLARSIDCKFTRIQFTPDTMPSDITGSSIYNYEKHRFEYAEGVIMSNIILADEINRTSPKTQASLLEAMEEGRVTVDGRTYELPRPFMVIATQNPVMQRGTYYLPESQLDRFMMKISVGYAGGIIGLNQEKPMNQGFALV